MGYRYQKKSNKGMLETGVLMLVWGAWFIVFFGYGTRFVNQQIVLWVYTQVQDWQPAQATLTSVRAGTFAILIEYTYVIRGKTYVGSRFGPGYFRLDHYWTTPEDRGKATKGDAGSSMQIFYNPRRPSESAVYIHEPTRSEYSKQARDAVWLIPLSSLIAFVVTKILFARVRRLEAQDKKNLG